MKHLALVIALTFATTRVASAEPTDNLTIDTTHDGDAVTLLAAQLPPADRPAVVAAFQRMLGAFHQLEPMLHMTHDEPAGVLAAFVVANVAVLTGTQSADARAALPKVLGQLRSNVASHANEITALHLDRQSVREQLEIVAVMMLGASVTQSQGAKTMAQHLLANYLGVGPNALILRPNGTLSWSGSPKGPLAELTGFEPMGDAHTAEVGAQVAAQVATLYTDTQTSVGYQSVSVSITETWMFKDNQCTHDITQVIKSGGIAADRVANPKSWSRCRVGGRGLEELTNGSWSAVRGGREAKLPPGFTLAGAYQVKSFSTTFGPGGSNSASWFGYTFDNSGHFKFGNGVGSTTGGVTVSATGGDGGTYTIDGNLITFRYGDGGVMVASFTTNLKTLDFVVINRRMYNR